MNRVGRFVDSIVGRFRKSRMEVTRHNFKEKKAEILEAIDSCTFLSIDGEFTGLNAYRGISPFDLPQQRYDKLQESARQFLLIQFGLCTFHYNEKSDSYTNQAYNFYVWPRPCNRQAPDPRFLCQTSSLDFLIGQGFDFNKLLRDGISYLKQSDLDRLKTSVKERQEQRKNIQTQSSENISIPPEQVDFLKGIHEKLEAFIASEEQSIELDKCNSFQRRLIYQTSKEKYNNLSLSSLTKTGGERIIMAVKASEDQKKLLESSKDAAELSDLEEAFGFSEVVRRISDSRKLIVGHNMVLDICHTLNQFCITLPEEYEDFKEVTNSIFPNIIDTKLMANTTPFRDEIFNSSLEELLRTVLEKPYCPPTVSPRLAGCGYTLSSDKFHEAGYDAFVTGICFISMYRRMAKLCASKEKRIEPTATHIKPFLNKLYLMKIVDIPYMNLAGPDLEPDRDHVFYLEIPSEWRYADVVHLFSPYCGVFVSWINDTSLLVALKDRGFSTTIQEHLKSSSLFKIHTYQEYMEMSVFTERNTSVINKSTYNTPALQTSSSKPEQGNGSPVRPGRLDTSGETGLAGKNLKRSFATLTKRPADTSPATRHSHNAGEADSSSSGITPMFEKSFAGVTGRGKAQVRPDLVSGEKRPSSPAVAHDIKRSRSINEKEFEEPPWD